MQEWITQQHRMGFLSFNGYLVSVERLATESCIVFFNYTFS